MKKRLVACLFSMVAVFASVTSFAQDCAPCAAATDVTCASCAPCASCVGSSCELFSGLRSLLACRPCVSAVTLTPSCTPCAVPEVTVAPNCGPIVKTSIPHGVLEAPACGSCGECNSCELIAPSCSSPMFPYLAPCLYNAVHRPINGCLKVVHGAFSALANATTPIEDCGFFKPAYVTEITCGSAATCAPVEVAPAPCAPAAQAPSCGPAVLSCNWWTKNFLNRSPERGGWHLPFAFLYIWVDFLSCRNILYTRWIWRPRALVARGKSGLHRIQRRITSADRKIRESATEKIPPLWGKGEMAR